MTKQYNVLIVEFNKDCDMLLNFASSVYDALIHLGCNVAYMPRDIWDLLWTGDENLPEHRLVAKCDFIISFNNVGIELDIYETLGIPLISICVDRPFHLMYCFGMDVKNTLCCWTDENDLKYAPAYFKNAVHKFLPHASEIVPNPWLFLSNDRHTDIVASCNNYVNDMPWLKRVKGSYGEDVFKSVMRLYSNSGMRLEDCVREVLRCGNEEMLDFMRADGKVIDVQARFDRRYDVLKLLVDADFKVDCFGAFWEDSDLNDKPGFIRHGFVPSKKVHAALEHTKILVNVFSVSNASSHERIFNSMQRGALCVTNSTDWLRKHFKDGESIVFYDLKDPAGLVEKVSFYLNNEEERLRVARNAMEIVQREHTWITRALQLIDIYEELTR